MTALARKLDPAGDSFQEDFARHASSLPGGSLGWLNARRRSAFSAFAATGVPNRRVEAWKYTDLANALDPGLQPASALQAVKPDTIFPPQEIELSFANGFLVGGANDKRIELIDLAKLEAQTPAWLRDYLGILASGADQPMGAASLALMRGGAAIRVRNDVSLHLAFANTPGAKPQVSHSRIVLIVENGVSVKLLETHSGAAGARDFRNIGFELVLKPNANLEHIRVQKDAATAVHVTSMGAVLENESRYRALYAALGAELSRLDINIRLAPHSEAVLHNVAALAAGIADTTSVMDHASPHTCSRQLFKSVLGGTARAVNQGRVVVREGAVKSDSHQLFRALLLSRRAEADAKPELEILADDVACGHGTAIGSLDEEALFYLRSRGIPEAEAKLLLIRAFLADAIEGFGDEAVHDCLWREIEAGLSAAGSAPS
jgi:Fe-S cluster assembly protein SufD